jgi:hypothetical protein
MLPCNGAPQGNTYLTCFANGVSVRIGTGVPAPQGSIIGAVVRKPDHSVCYTVERVGATGLFLYRDASGSEVARGTTGPANQLDVTCAGGQTFRSTVSIGCPSPDGPKATCTSTMQNCQ